MNSIPSPSATVARFTAAAIIAIALIGVGLVVFGHRSTEKEAVTNARDVTVATGSNVISMTITDGLLTEDPAAISSMDKVVRQSVLRNGIVRVKLWKPDGTIIYSDEPSYIGQKFSLDQDELAALDGQPDAGVSNLNRPENVHERNFKKLLEVYDGVRTPSGKPVLFEAYQNYSKVDQNASHLLGSLFGPLLGGLFILLVLQVPLALGLARKLERGRAEHEDLLSYTVGLSETERQHIASDLHDGVVQRLAGSSYSLGALVKSLKDKGSNNEATTVDQVASDLRIAVKELRSLIVAVAPPSLRDEGLEAAILDATATLEAESITTFISVSTETLTADREILVYRVIQETLRNIAKHAHAKSVSVQVDNPVPGTVRCSITDDGIGFDAQQQAQRQTQGHVGLHLLEQLIVAAGGKLEVSSTAGEGTTVTAEMPVS